MPDATSEPEEACAGRRCSRDLHEVRDGCTDEIVETCRADQGCGDGKCVTPCEAASLAHGSLGTPGANNVAHIDCPAGVEVAYQAPAMAHVTSLYDAFRIETDVPVSAYSMFPYGGARSYMPTATLLLPTSSWGTNYVLVDGYDGGDLENPPFVQIVAQEDGTIVRIRPCADIRDGEGVTGIAQGLVGEWTLRRGQVLELRQPGSLAGSPLESNHPVALFGGAQCPYIPANVQACDTLQQQIAPLDQWGNSYSAVPYKSRLEGVPESVIWRIGAARDGTTLTYEPTRPNGAPLTLSGGQFVHFESEYPFSAKSQDAAYPIYAAAFMTSQLRYEADGDPEFVSIVPNEQFLDNYVFFVDHTFARSMLTFVRRKDARGFHDVKLDCLGSVPDWQPLGADAEFAWIDLTRGGRPVDACGYGRHEASSDGPFAVYVWGIDVAASYGYPAGAGSRTTTPFRIDLQ